MVSINREFMPHFVVIVMRFIFYNQAEHLDNVSANNHDDDKPEAKNDLVSQQRSNARKWFAVATLRNRFPHTNKYLTRTRCSNFWRWFWEIAHALFLIFSSTIGVSQATFWRKRSYFLPLEFVTKMFRCRRKLLNWWNQA